MKIRNLNESQREQIREFASRAIEDIFFDGFWKQARKFRAIIEHADPEWHEENIGPVEVFFNRVHEAL